MERKLVGRHKKVAFAGVNEGKFHRMKGFTTLTTNKNPMEYSRHYVDEPFETTDVVGLSNSIDFNFDQYAPDPVHDYLIDIIDNEKLGDDAVIPILVVDFTQKEGDVNEEYKGKLREYSVIPNTEGSTTDAYTYEGTFKVKTKAEEVIVTSDDNWETCTIKNNEETP